jgi:hypothetical protein
MICDENNKTEVVLLTSIDSFCFQNNIVPTYIKLDVEGFENDAIDGALKTIALHKPKLTISVYHKPQDIFFFINKIHLINPDYKLYLRHHSRNIADTIRYCI